MDAKTKRHLSIKSAIKLPKRVKNVGDIKRQDPYNFLGLLNALDKENVKSSKGPRPSLEIVMGNESAGE